MRARVPAASLAAVLLLGAGLTDASTAEAPARASAAATLVSGTDAPTGRVSVQDAGRRSRRVAPSRGAATVASGEVVATASRRRGRGQASASAAARSVRVFDGLVTAYGVRRSVEATAAGRTYSGRVEGLKLDGRTIGTVTSGRSYDVGDVGTATVNRDGAALSVTLSRATNGYPAGATVTVASVRASASNGAAPGATPTPTSTPEPSATPASKAKAEAKRRRAARSDRRQGAGKRRKAPAVPRRLTDQRFAFPVFGSKGAVASTFGADRQIGAHQGNDVFAPFGSPVLAVTDGELFKVGTLPISGNRLWLRSEAGDEFFYAHLSAFSPAAVNGRHVKAGQVLGFTGNTGDAEPTPPHVHFEIHPGGGDAVDPNPILEAWRLKRDVPPGAWLTRYGTDTEQRPGALVEVRDFIAGE